jgi:hypothetical protein
MEDWSRPMRWRFGSIVAGAGAASLSIRERVVRGMREGHPRRVGPNGPGGYDLTMILMLGYGVVLELEDV